MIKYEKYGIPLSNNEKTIQTSKLKQLKISRIINFENKYYHNVLTFVRDISIKMEIAWYEFVFLLTVEGLIDFQMIEDNFVSLINSRWVCFWPVIKTTPFNHKFQYEIPRNKLISIWNIKFSFKLFNIRDNDL